MSNDAISSLYHLMGRPHLVFCLRAGEPAAAQRRGRRHREQPEPRAAERAAPSLGHLHLRRAQHRGRRSLKPNDAQRQM